MVREGTAPDTCAAEGSGETLPYYHRVSVTLVRLERQLRTMDLWGDEPPPPAAFASTTPFCIDTMSLDDWLQWVFLPRMGELIERGEPLPPACGIAPLAEETLVRERADAAPLVAILASLDRLLSEPHRV